MASNIRTQVTVMGILAAGTALAASHAYAVPDTPTEWEKCANIVKEGMNDCGALDGKHECAGQAEYDNADNEWIYPEDFMNLCRYRAGYWFHQVIFEGVAYR